MVLNVSTEMHAVFLKHPTVTTLSPFSLVSHMVTSRPPSPSLGQGVQASGAHSLVFSLTLSPCDQEGVKLPRQYWTCCPGYRFHHNDKDEKEYRESSYTAGGNIK